jgi:hypothetical protein
MEPLAAQEPAACASYLLIAMPEALGNTITVGYCCDPASNSGQTATLLKRKNVNNVQTEYG